MSYGMMFLTKAREDTALQISTLTSSWPTMDAMFASQQTYCLWQTPDLTRYTLGTSAHTLLHIECYIFHATALATMPVMSSCCKTQHCLVHSHTPC